MWDSIERRGNSNWTINQEHTCPLSAEDAYQLIFEMKATQKKLNETTEKMDKLCQRITKFEQLYYEGKGVALGARIGAAAVVTAIVGFAVILWSAITGKIQFSDIFKIF